MTLQHTGIRALTARAWALLQNNWILFGLMMLETLFTLFLLGGQAGGLNPLLFVLMIYLHLVVLGGWFYQMKRIVLQPEYRTTWSDFFSGVSLHAGRMLVGGGYLLLVLLAVMFVSSVAINVAVPAPQTEVLTELQNLAAAGDNQKLWDFVQAQPELQSQIGKVLVIFFAAMGVLGLFLLSIFFWPYNVVLYGMRWREAWRFSRRFMMQAWRPLLPLAAAWTMVHVFFVLSALTGQVLIVMLTYIAYLLAKTLLPLMTLLFLVDYAPEQLTPLEEEPAA